MYTTLISADQLMALQASGAPLMVFDCSFDLMKPEAGDRAIPRGPHPRRGLRQPRHRPEREARRARRARRAWWWRTDDGPPASGGRHPLPSREKFAAWLSSVGFANDMQAVVYDRNGANYCGRLWWMLKWMGHEAVAVLDGGLQAWQAAGGEVTDREEPAHFQSNFVAGDAPARAGRLPRASPRGSSRPARR